MCLHAPVRMLIDGAPYLLDVLAHVARVHAAGAGARVEEVGGVESALYVGRVEDHLGVSGLTRGAHEERGVDAGRRLAGGDRVANEATDDLMGVAKREIVAADQFVREMTGRAPERPG